MTSFGLWLLCLCIIISRPCNATQRERYLRHTTTAAVQQHRKLRSALSVDATYLIQFASMESMEDFHDTYNAEDVHVTAWYPQFQVAAVTEVSSDALLMDLLNDPSIAYMEADEWVYGSASAMNTTTTEASMPTNVPIIPTLPVSQPQQKNQSPVYTGTGIRVYVLDSGIQLDHNEFNNNINVRCAVTSCDDRWGHGTHVAALIGGRTFGVAPHVELMAYPVLGADSRARFSQVLAALDTVVVMEQSRNNNTTRALVNLSLGTPRVASILNAAVERTVEAGIPVIVAAGNGATDACRWSPASAKGSIAVGALDQTGHRYEASNYGPCVDLYAPGEHITSAWRDHSHNTITGTSSASPFITGIAALYLERDPSLTPAELLDLFLQQGSTTSNDNISGDINATITTITAIPAQLMTHPSSEQPFATQRVFSTNETTISADVLSAARSFIQNTTTAAVQQTSVPTMSPTEVEVSWFDQIRQTVQVRFWNNNNQGGR